ncbi:MAG TPA: hypothetical protein PKH68_01340 [Paludibacteraceae bacterium]|nr:hypothetical protein [Paludibacteraceae bacterium]
MIIDALIATINPIVDCYTAIGDLKAELPFSVIQVAPEPIRIKDGIVGYTQKVSVALVDNDVDRIEENTVAVRAAIEALTGLVEECQINSVMFESENGVIFDPETQTYQNSFEFTVDTNTR